MFRTFLSTLALLALLSPCLAQDELFDPITFQRIPSFDDFAWDRGPVVGDLTGDGLPEIVVVAAGGGSDVRDRILVYNASHTAEPLFTLIPDDLPAGYDMNMTPGIADVDGDGLKEVIATASLETSFSSDSCPTPDYRPTWHNYGCTHWTSYVLKWEFTDDLTEPEYHRSDPYRNWGAFGTPVVADIRENEGVTGADELVFVCPGTVGTYYSYPNHYYARWGNACVVLWWTGQSWANDHVNEQCMYDYCPGTRWNFIDYLINDQCAAAGDLDGDGLSEIVWLLPNADGEATLFVGKMTDPPDINRTVLTDKYPLNIGDGGAIPSLVLCDYDLDGQLEAVFPVAQNLYGNGVEQMARVEFSGIEPIQITYRDLPTFPTPLSTHGQYAMAVADEPYVQNDLDIFVVAHDSTTDNVSFLWFRPQIPGWYVGPSDNWPKTVLESSALWRHGYTPAIAATLGGTDLEFVTQTIQDTQTNRYRHLRLDNTFGSDTNWTVTGNRYDSQPILSASTIADLNGDGQAELVTMFGTSGTDAQIHAYEVGPYSRELIEWSGYQNGPQHTGLYAQPVSGMQPRDEMTWSGRIIVHDYYWVSEDQTLIIEPGTVVEFRPGAWLFVFGTLLAVGQGKDSIYFKPDGTSPWGWIDLSGVSLARLERCVIHGGDA
ncbi:VCBS repeat-containing protein, partial [bacterium]|nr:VCBS repeat-containing protein [bacterium]